MSIALSAVVAANPTNFTFPINYSVGLGKIMPQAQVIKIQDYAGVSIDATAGTITAVVQVGPPGNTAGNINGSWPQDTGLSAANPAGLTVDLSVSGQVTLKQAINTTSPAEYKPGTTLNVAIFATDSGGGSQQCLAIGSMTVRQVA